MSVAFLALLAGCSGYIPFSSGALEGSAQPAPADWSGMANVKIVQLETQPDDPYSVNIWAVATGGELYVFAGDNHTTWIQHMEANPRVRLQVGEAIYALRASRVTDATEFEQFAKAWESKYGNRPRNENVAETYLMRLRVDNDQER